MKKLFWFIVMIIISLNNYAQKKVGLGLRTGINYSNVSNTNLDYKTGLYLSAFLNIQYSNFYALQPELGYSNQGGKARSSEDQDVKIDYVSLGLTNKFFVFKDKRFHFLFGVNIDLNYDDNFMKIENNSANNDVFFLDLALYGGLGYQFDFGLALEARYKHGLKSILEDDYFLLFPIDKAHKNYLFQFGMAYKFEF